MNVYHVPTQVVSNHSLSTEELKIINDQHFRIKKTSSLTLYYALKIIFSGIWTGRM